MSMAGICNEGAFIELGAAQCLLVDLLQQALQAFSGFGRNPQRLGSEELLHLPKNPILAG